MSDPFEFGKAPTLKTDIVQRAAAFRALMQKKRLTEDAVVSTANDAAISEPVVQEAAELPAIPAKQVPDHVLAAPPKKMSFEEKLAYDRQAAAENNIRANRAAAAAVLKILNG